MVKVADPKQVGASGNEMARLEDAEIASKFAEKDRFGDFTRAALYEAVTDPVTGEDHGIIHITNPYEADGVIVSIPTGASKEDVEQIIARISPIPEFCAMLSKLAECYELGLPLMIEGGTSVGKTFMVNKFTEMVYGKGVKPLDFYCSGQTDVSDLIGKWVPREGVGDQVHQKWEQFLRSQHGQERLEVIADGIARTSDQMTPDDQARMYTAQMQRLAAEAGLSLNSDFTFQLGAIPKAFMGEYVDGKFQVREGAEGFIIHVQEAGLAKPSVLNALLRIRGEQGRIAESLQLWEDSGRVVNKGPRTFVVFTTNPADGYLDRKPIDPALSRGLEWQRFGEGLSDASVEMTARKIFTYSLGNNEDPPSYRAKFDFRLAPEVGAAIGNAMAGIHQTIAKHLNSPDQDDPQVNPVVMDNMFKVAQMLQSHQVSAGETIDVGKTLMRAISRTYLERCSPAARDDLRQLVQEALYGDTSKQELDGQLLSLAQRLDRLAREAQQAKKGSTGSGAAPAAKEAVVGHQFGEFVDAIDGLLQ